MKTAISRDELHAISASWRNNGEKIVFVPTMGALHQGHLDLVRFGKSLGDRIIVSIFVNPTQFGPKEDFAAYPRTMDQDGVLLRETGVDLLFIPDVATIYPPGFQTFVNNPSLASILCGAHRPGHFQGVLTVVNILMGLVRPNFMIMGKKDYQQVYLVKRMINDFHLPVEVVAAETTRESDGLAMSSRNRYLSPEERSVAPLIFSGLKAAGEGFRAGEIRPAKLIEKFQSVLSQSPLLSLEYCEIRSSIDLSPFENEVDETATMLVAARLGKARLIDNLQFAQG